MMREHSTTEDFSMEDYFEDGLQEQEPSGNRKQNTKEKQKRIPSGERRKRAARGKKFLMILCSIILLILIVWLVIFRVVQGNDGERFAEKLSTQIGTALSQAGKKAKVTFEGASDYPALTQSLQNASEIQLTESKRSCKISGIHFPEWAILCGTDGENLQTVTYYNFEILEDDLFGIKRKAYIDPNILSKDATVEDTEKKLDLSPYCIRYLSDKTQERSYRYHYKDGDTSDMVSYVIDLKFDENGKLTTYSDTRMNYLNGLLFDLQGEG